MSDRPTEREELVSRLRAAIIPPTFGPHRPGSLSAVISEAADALERLERELGETVDALEAERKDPGSLAKAAEFAAGAEKVAVAMGLSADAVPDLLMRGGDTKGERSVLVEAADELVRRAEDAYAGSRHPAPETVEEGEAEGEGNAYEAAAKHLRSLAAQREADHA